MLTLVLGGVAVGNRIRPSSATDVADGGPTTIVGGNIPATTLSPVTATTPTTPVTTTINSATTSLGASPANLRADFAELRATLGVRTVGVAFAPVGTGPTTQLGDWRAGPAWSTIKVPISIAALKQSGTAATRSLVHQAIAASDNQAAETLWSQLGGGTAAADAVDAALAVHGDTRTRTQAQRVRPQYTPFGQTTWTLADQVAFGSALACTTTDGPVYDEMTRISASQRWGLGHVRGAAFKGGWGPDRSGRYLVRQFGVLKLNGHLVAVALAVEPASGTFDSGTRALSKIADWLARNLRPTSGSCD